MAGVKLGMSVTKNARITFVKSGNVKCGTTVCDPAWQGSLSLVIAKKCCYSIKKTISQFMHKLSKGLHISFKSVALTSGLTRTIRFDCIKRKSGTPLRDWRFRVQ